MKRKVDPQEKIKGSLSELKKCCIELRKLGKKICLTSGAFDIIHTGHVRYLIDAGDVGGDILVVGVDSDYLVRKRKGSGRPINPQTDRCYVIAAFECVNLVVSQDDCMSLVKAVQPEYFVASRASEDKPESRDDCKWVRENGGEVIVFEPKSANHSTQIIESIRNRK